MQGPRPTAHIYANIAGMAALSTNHPLDLLDGDW